MTNPNYSLSEALEMPSLVGLAPKRELATRESDFVQAALRGQIAVEGQSEDGTYQAIPPNLFTAQSIQFDRFNNSIRFSFGSAHSAVRPNLNPRAINYGMLDAQGRIKAQPRPPIVYELVVVRECEIDKPKGKAGRKEEYDWPSFDLKVHEFVKEEGTPNPKADPSWSRAKLVKDMQAWCLKTWGKEPAKSAIEKRVKTVLESIG